MVSLIDGLIRQVNQLNRDQKQRVLDFARTLPRPLPRASELLTTLDAHAGTLREFDVQNIGVFGSCSRDEATPQSDLDLLMRVDSVSFRRYMDLKFLLEDLFRCPVDLVLEQDLREELRPDVMRDIRYAEGL